MHAVGRDRRRPVPLETEGLGHAGCGRHYRVTYAREGVFGHPGRLFRCSGRQVAGKSTQARFWDDSTQTSDSTTPRRPSCRSAIGVRLAERQADPAASASA